MEYQQNVELQVPPVFAAADIASLEVTRIAPGRNRVMVNPTPTGLAKLTAATSGNAGQRIGFVLNGACQRVTYFGSPITGKFALSGHPDGLFSDEALRRVIDN